MRNYTIENNFPSIDYIINNWPRTKPLLKRFILSNHKPPDLYKICLSCLNELAVYKTRKLERILKRLTYICSRNTTSNTFHDSHHFKAVIIISCVISKKMKLTQRDKILLILIALSHDIAHQGRRIISQPYYQEEKSCKVFMQLCYEIHLTRKETNRVSKIFKSTYFPLKPENVDDKLQKIILDADILASIMFDVDTGLKFTSRLRHELRLSNSKESIFKSFLDTLTNKSLYMDSSRKLC
jgi:hypothetical protein